MSAPSIAREVAKFVAASLVAVLVFAAASVPLLRYLGREEAIREARSVARLAAAGVVEPNLQDGLLRGDRAAIARIDRVVQERVLSDAIVRVKIWTGDGRIVYSDEPRLIGARFMLEDEERTVLTTDAVAAGVSDLVDAENRFERAEGQLLEVYVRVRTPDGTPLLFEAYRRFDSVLASGRRIWVPYLSALLGALLLLWLVLVPLAYRLAARVRRVHAERESLLRRTLDASNDERRRLAGELHDGVVQDLAGISYSLAAVARSPAAQDADPDLAATLREGAEVTRASMQRLRTLLVEIHPPNLRAAGLEAALADVLAPLEQGGVRVQLQVDEPPGLDRESEELIFRAAREAIRNVSEHAAATRLSVEVARLDGGARLTVVDDGAGFGTAERESRRQAGHIGLSLLEELAVHAGARLEIRSVPGAGTTLVLDVVP